MKVSVKPSLHASWIDRDAIEIVKRLQTKGHTTYLVGGCIRDLLCNMHPKDYDIATSALPNEIRKLVHGSYVIGKRFRLVLVKRGDQQFEVATFRRSGRAEDFTEGDDAPVGDNFFGTPEEDAIRRDFSMNALFYDPIKGELIDFPRGVKDVENRLLCMIGDPATRLQEDPIRSLRALRFSHKLNFKIEPSLRGAMAEHADWCAKSVLPRRREEYLKLLRLQNPAAAFLEMWDLGLLKVCLPSLAPIFDDLERQAIFLNYLDRLKDFAQDLSNPIEIYVPFVMAVRAAMEGLDFTADAEEAFYRIEMGVFKAEWAEIESAVHFRHRLKDIEHFRRRGHRRQVSFVAHPSLRLALRICAFEYELNAFELQFWRDRMNGIPLPARPARATKASKAATSDEAATETDDSNTDSETDSDTDTETETLRTEADEASSDLKDHVPS